jgi:hypothetical protein
LQVLRHATTAVRRKPIPEKDQPAHARLLRELFQEADELLVVIVASNHAEEEPTTLPIPAVCQHRADRELFPIERMNNNRGLSARSPSPSYRGSLRNTALIEKYYPCPPDFGVFFTWTQIRLFQWRICCSSRCLARNVGRCRLHPIFRRTLHTCPG